MKIVPNSVEPVEGSLYQIMGEASPYEVYDVVVVVTAVNGKQYRHRNVFKSWFEDEDGIPFINHNYRASINALCDRVNAAGEIDLAHWIEYDKGPSYALGEVDEATLMDDEERAIRGL